MADPAVGGSLVRAEAWSPEFGDMVWGKVKSHPWWPGHVYSRDLSDDQEVLRGYREDLVLVAFFGDGSYGWFEPHELVRFADQFAEKIAVGGNRPLAAAVAESIDEIARRSALALLCPCRGPDSFRAHSNAGFLLVNVPGFDSNAEYRPAQVTAAQERFVPGRMLGFLQDAAVQQRDAAQTAARTLPGIEMAAMLVAYRRSRYEKYDITYAEAFGVDPEKALEAEMKAEAERSQRARPLRGRQRLPLPEKEAAPPARGRRGAAGAAARLMEKIVPGAPAMKSRASSSSGSKKDQYLLKRREDAARAALPDAPEDGGPPPGFPPAPAEPQTPPLPGSGGGAGDEEEEFMLQRRALPPAAEGSSADADVPPKKKAKAAKKAKKREREEPESSDAMAAAAGEEPKKKTKKKKLAELNGGFPTAGASSSGAKSGAALSSSSSPPKVDLEGLDLKQVMSDLQKLPVLPFHGASGGRISDASQSFVLAFRSKHYKKSYENDPPEESKKTGSDNAPAAAAAAADGQPPKPAKKKKPVMRPTDPTSSGVKRGPSDRQEEMASKKKIKLEKLKNLAADKKAGLELKDTAAASAAPLGAQPRAGMKEKAAAAAKKKTPAAAAAPARAVRTASPTALMMKFPLKSTLPSVASLKARFARFGPLDIDGIRVYWKSHMCRVIYRFQSDAEVALKYAKANAMFGQLTPNYYLRQVESSSADLGNDAAAPPAAPPRSDLRLMETTPFRPGSSGNGAPLTLSRAAPARAAAGQQPKSILKKSNEDGALAAAAARDSPRVKFVLDTGDGKVEPPAVPDAVAAAAAPGSSKMARSVGFAQPPLMPPPRPAQPSNLQPPMHTQQLQQPLQLSRAPMAQQQQLPPPPPLPYQPPPSYQPPRTNEPMQYLPPPRLNEPSPYAPRHMDAPPSFAAQPPYQLPRHSEGTLPLAHPGQPPLPYPPRPGFPGQQYRPNDMPPAHSVGHNAASSSAAAATATTGEDMPVWKRGPKEFDAELMRVMLGIAKLVEPLTDKNGKFPYHLFSHSE